MKEKKDIYIKDEGKQFSTVIFNTERAQKLMKENLYLYDALYYGNKLDVYRNELHKVVSWATSHDLSVDSEVTIKTPKNSSR